MSSSLSGSSAPLKGVMFMIIGGALLTANDAIMKWLTGGYPTGQIIFIRGLFVFIPIGYLIWRSGGLSRLRITSIKGQALRAILVVVGTFCFVTGLSLLPLADAVAIAFAGPLFVTALAAGLLKEIIGWKRWSAVFVGFLGVMVIIRPTGEAMQWAALLPLTASFTGALRDIVTRRIAATEQSEVILLTTTTVVCMGGLVTAPFGWAPVASSDWGLFALSGLLLGGAHFLMIDTFRYAEAALVAPFKYSTIIWATLLGYGVWGDTPDVWTVVGSSVVIASGLYILKRESLRKSLPAQKS